MQEILIFIFQMLVVLGFCVSLVLVTFLSTLKLSEIILKKFKKGTSKKDETFNQFFIVALMMLSLTLLGILILF